MNACSRVRASLLSALLAPVLLAQTARAGIVRVIPDGSGDATTIQGGIDLAQPGDTVVVYAGVYHEHVLIAKDLLVESRGGAEVTAIDGDGQHGTVVRIEAPGAVDSSFGGFTVRNGHANMSSQAAAGIHVSVSSPRVHDNVVRNHVGNGVSAGNGSRALFEHNVMYRNTSAGFASLNATPVIRANLFLSNGDGVAFYAHPPREVSGNVIANNGFGIVGTAYDVVIANNTIVSNEVGLEFDEVDTSCRVTKNIIASNTIGIDVGPFSGDVPALDTNDVWANTGVNYGNVSVGAGDISADPLFCDPANGDYHIGSASPCVLGPGLFIGALDIGC